MPQWGQIITLTFIAIALGMDAFSLGIGVGMKRISLRKITTISLTIGIFHIIMPLIGIIIGHLLGNVIKEIAVMVGGGMLCFLGMNMLIQLLKHKERDSIHIQSITSVVLLSLTVSVDSLSAGLSLGLFASDLVLAILLFGFVGMIMAAMGLYLGRFVGYWLGRYGEAIGGIILILLGSKFLW
nr:manganese efflux pump [Polycladospora coralii]